MVVLKPIHITAGEAVAVMAGRGFTVTETVAVPEQPLALVQVTEYVAVDVGVAVNEAPLPDGLHVYVLPPAAEMVADSPLQSEAGEALAVIVGAGFTETVTLAAPVHPAADVPVTV